jgi:hypothetical protein
LTGAAGEEGGLAEFDGGAAIGAGDDGGTALADAVEEVLHLAGEGFEADGIERVHRIERGLGPDALPFAVRLGRGEVEVGVAVEVEQAALADDLRAELAVGEGAAGEFETDPELADRAAGELDDRDGAEVGQAVRAMAADVGEDAPRLAAGEPAHQVEVVDALAHEDAGVGVGVPGALADDGDGPGLGEEGPEAELAHRADPALGDQALRALVDAAEALGLDDHQADAGRVAGGDHRVALGDAGGHRLLGQDVLAGGGGLEGLMLADRLGPGEDDGVDVVAGEQGGEGRFVGDAVASREVGRAAALGDGDEGAALRVARHDLGVGVRHEAGADHADAYAFHWPLPIELLSTVCVIVARRGVGVIAVTAGACGRHCGAGAAGLCWVHAMRRCIRCSEGGPPMMTPAEVDMYAREMQRERRAEAAKEALARKLAPGPIDRLLAALRPSRVERPKAARPAMPVASPTTAR